MDAYAECPCGSGKKIKFCCHEIVHEMQKVERLRENQPRLAINMLEELRHTHPQNPWVVTSEAMLQIQAEEPAAARKSLAPFLKQHPTHPRANALYALACGQMDGFVDTRKMANRAFKLCAPATINTVGAIAVGMFQEHREHGQVMAARQLLSFVIRLTPEGEQKRHIVELLMMLDAAESVPWPLRGVHVIPSYAPPEEIKPQVAKAHQLSKVCCFDEAVALLRKAAEKSPTLPEVWHDLALHQAWEGDHDAASESFRKAAELYTDNHLAAECEVLSQLLGPSESVLELPRQVYMGRVKEPAKVLERLRSKSHIIESEQEDESDMLSRRFTVLSRDVPEEGTTLPPEEWPIHLGSISLVTSSEQAEHAIIQWSDLEEVGCLSEMAEQLFGDLLDDQPFDSPAPPEAVAEVQDAEAAPAEPTEAGDEDDGFGAGLDVSVEQQNAATEAPPEAVETSDVETADESETDSGDRRWVTIPLPISTLDRIAHRRMPPQGTTAREYRAHIRQAVASFVNDVWEKATLESLGGATPTDAAQTPELRARLEAAITVLDATSQTQSLPLSREIVQRFADQTTRDADAAANLQGYSLFQLKRLKLDTLTDEQLDHVIGRADLAQLPWLASDALQERLRRKKDAQERLPDLYALSQIAEGLEDHAHAVQWVHQAIEEASSMPNSFETLLGLKVRLVNLWVDYDAEDQKFKDLLVDLWHNYGSKVPHLREQLISAVNAAGIEPPWDKAILVATGDGGLSAPSGSAKKLILPGME